MKNFLMSLTAAGGLITLSAQSLAIAQESVTDRGNIIAETGINVGPCLGKGNLIYPPKPYKGVPFFLPRNDAKIKTAHDSVTASEAKWIHDLDGPATNNRMYLDGAGHRILVFSVCLEHQCDTHSLSGAYNLTSGEYGLQISEDGKKRVLGSLSEASLAGVACAESIDDRIRSEAATAINRQRKK